MQTFSGKLGIQQRVFPAYRAPFFDTLAGYCAGGLELFAGDPRTEEAIDTANSLIRGKFTAGLNIHLFSGRFYSCLQPGLVAWLERTQPDALIVEANPRYLSTPSAIRWMHRHDRLVLGWGLGAPPVHGWMSSYRNNTRNHFYAQLDGMIAYSQQGAAEYEASGVPARCIFVAPNSAAFRPQAPVVGKPDHWKGKAVILFVGRLQARKRLDMLFKACAALPTELQPGLVIVGDGPDRLSIEADAQAYYPQTVFTGAKTGSELAELFQSADLFVLPGTGGLAIQQALSYGLPVIAGEGDGSQSQMVRPENGRLIPPGSLPALTQALAELLSDPARLRRMGRESYRIARDEVNIETMAEQFIKAINAVVQR